MKKGLIYSVLLMIIFYWSCEDSSKSELLLIAGDGQSGFIDGRKAQFYKPIRLAPFNDSTVLVADIYNHAIRMVTLRGMVTTLVGGPDKKGYQDGPASSAQLESPHGVAYDVGSGKIYFAEASNHVIRAMEKNEMGEYVVKTIAGSPGQEGFKDGKADSAQFSSPHAIVIAADGGILVADIGNARIRKIKNNYVSTYAGSGETGNQDGTYDKATFHYAMDLFSEGSDIFVADAGSHLIRKIDANQSVSTLPLNDVLSTPHGISLDQNGNFYIADMGTHRILKINDQHEVTVIAGSGVKGPALNEFNKPADVLVHGGLLWIADLDNHQIKTLPLN